MAMGKRKSEQAPMWVPTTDLPVSPGHPFYARLNAILDEAGFDRFAEEQCRPFYAPVSSMHLRSGRPNVSVGVARPKLRARALTGAYGGWLYLFVVAGARNRQTVHFPSLQPLEMTVKIGVRCRADCPQPATDGVNGCPDGSATDRTFR